MENQNQNQNDEPDQLVLMKAANLTELNKNLQNLLQELRKLDNGSYFRSVVEALGRLSKELQLKMVDVEKAAKTPAAAAPAPNITVRPPQVQVDAPDISGIEKLLNKQLPTLVQQLIDGMPEVPEADFSGVEELLKELKTTMAQVRDRPLPVPQMPTTLKVTNPDGTVISGGGGGGAATIANGADVAEGATTDAIVAAGATGSVSAKLRRATQGIEDLKTGVSLAASTAAIGKLVANSGVVIGDVNVATLPIAFNTGTRSSTTQRVTIATDDSVTVQPGNTANTTPWLFSMATATPVLKNGLTNAASSVVSSTAATLTSYYIYNPNTSGAYVQIFDVATAGGVTLGTTTPKWSLALPALGAANLSNLHLSFANGIQVAATSTATGSTAPFVALDCNFSYR